MSRYFLGVDGGGTKTDVLCSDETGSIIGQGSSGPTNLTSTSIGAASFNLLEAIRQATERLFSLDQRGQSEASPFHPAAEKNSHAVEFVCLAMGLAGMDTPQEYERAMQVFQDALRSYTVENFILVNDSVIALENGSDNPNAIVLISGTGTIAFGRNEQGQTAKTSGMDFLLTDQGSGYYIGRQVLREAVKSYDGRRPKSILEQLVCDFFRIHSIEELKSKVYNPLLSKIEIAELAPLCTQAFEQGDQVARSILDHAVDELVSQVATVARKLHIAEQNFDCVFAGSVMKIPYIHNQVKEKLSGEFSQMQVRMEEKPPVYGALKLAMKQDKTIVQ